MTIPEYVQSQNELCTLAGMSRNAAKLIDDRLPDDKKIFVKSADGYHVATFVQRLLAYRMQEASTDIWTKQALARLAGYTPQRMGEFEKENADTFYVESDNGGFDLAEFVQRWAKFRENRSGGGDSYDAVRTIHEKVKTRKTELEVQRISGKLVEAAEVERYWVGIAHTVSQSLMHVAAAAAPQVTGMDSVQDVRYILEDEIRKALQNMEVPAIPDVDVKQTVKEEDDDA